MRYFMLAGLLILAGCTHAGPYVTGISSDGKGGLIISKSSVEFNSFLGVIANKGATESTIQVIPKE